MMQVLTDIKRKSQGKEGRKGVLPFSVDRIRDDFPILATEMFGSPLCYLDNGATTQKPRCVIECLQQFFERENANIHRGVYPLSEEATARYERVRSKIKSLIGCRDEQEVIFTKGTTEGINLVAQAYGRQVLKKDDEILLTHMEHHSNIVPWQMVAQQTGAKIRVAPINDRGELILEEWARLLTPRTRMVAVTFVSNALGTINPVQELVARAHEVGAKVLVDAAQAIAHLPVDVTKIDCDFLAFSGHKFFAPTGVGVLYGKRQVLEEMAPYQGGGDMIRTVSFEKTTYQEVPHKFEAGTPPIAEVIALGVAVDYFQSVFNEAVMSYEDDLLSYALGVLEGIPSVRLIGEPKKRAGVISFVLDDVHAHDVGTILSREGICIRAGHHCAQPVMQFFKIPASVRASICFYNTRAEIDRLAMGLRKVQELFNR